MKDFVDTVIEENQDLLPEDLRNDPAQLPEPQYPDEDAAYDRYRDNWTELLADRLEAVINNITAEKGYYHDNKLKALNHAISHLQFLKTLVVKT